MEDTKKLLKKAVDLAKITGEKGNHPCGTVIVDQNGKIIAESGNEVFTTPDITAHAEMQCLRKASKELMDKKSGNVYTLYSSLEPCCGCAFFIERANIRKVVYASKDRYRPGIIMLKSNFKFVEYFKDFELIEEPYPDLRDKALRLMKEYFLSKNRPGPAKFFEPIG